MPHPHFILDICSFIDRSRPKCPFCGKAYSLYFMSRHIATKHTQKLDYQCEICSMRFWKEKQLQHHKDEVR